MLVYGAAPPGGLGEEFKAHPRRADGDGPHRDRARAGAAEAAGVTASSVELVDAKPADALVQVGDQVDATVIVVGTAGESPLQGAMLGLDAAQAAAPGQPAGALRPVPR